jgi:predicted DsbA family dithiol-disulfide isomerase
MAKLEDNNALQQVIEQESYWQKLGVSSIPAVVFNRKSALAGAQPIEAFKHVLVEELASL